MPPKPVAGRKVVMTAKEQLASAISRGQLEVKRDGSEPLRHRWFEPWSHFGFLYVRDALDAIQPAGLTRLRTSRLDGGDTILDDFVACLRCRRVVVYTHGTKGMQTHSLSCARRPPPPMADQPVADQPTVDQPTAVQPTEQPSGATAAPAAAEDPQLQEVQKQVSRLMGSVPI